MCGIAPAPWRRSSFINLGIFSFLLRTVGNGSYHSMTSKLRGNVMFVSWGDSTRIAFVVFPRGLGHPHMDKCPRFLVASRP